VDSREKIFCSFWFGGYKQSIIKAMLQIKNYKHGDDTN
jgi:hypothetical protein